jgi:hypothetical protein
MRMIRRMVPTLGSIASFLANGQRGTKFLRGKRNFDGSFALRLGKRLQKPRKAHDGRFKVPKI